MYYLWLISNLFMKHRHRFVIIGIVIIILVISQQVRIQVPQLTPSVQPSSQQNKELITLTGILLSSPNSNNRNKRSQTLSQNNDFLYGWIYDISYNSAINWFNKQPFPITLIVENAKYQQYTDDFTILDKKLNNDHITLLKDEQLGISYTHAKTFVGNRRRAIQTANLNRSSFVDNREHFFLSNNPVIRDNLIALFKLDSKKIANPDSVSASDYQQFVDESSANLLVCPLNCREKIENLIRTAHSRIRISAQYVIDKRIINLLIKQKNLDIRIRTNNSDSNRNLIRALGQERILFEDKIYNHDKLLIVDDTMMIGSMNFSDNALDNNREIGIILTDPRYIEQVQGLFQQ